MKTEVTKVERGTLLSLDNLKYGEVLQKYTHLERVHMDDTKAELPIHIILRASDYAKIKTENKPKIGRPGESVVGLTQFGWTIMSPGKEVDLLTRFKRKWLQQTMRNYANRMSWDCQTNQVQINQM